MRGKSCRSGREGCQENPFLWPRSAALRRSHTESRLILQRGLCGEGRVLRPIVLYLVHIDQPIWVKGILMSSPDKNDKKAESGLSLLQGLAILAVLGLIGAAIARYFAG